MVKPVVDSKSEVGKEIGNESIDVIGSRKGSTASASTSSSSSSNTSNPIPIPSAATLPSSPNPNSNFKINLSSPRSSISTASTATVNPAATVARRVGWRSSISGPPPPSRSSTSISAIPGALSASPSSGKDSDSSTSQSSSERLSGSGPLHPTNSSSSATSTSISSTESSIKRQSMESDENEPSHIQINSTSLNNSKLASGSSHGSDSPINPTPSAAAPPLLNPSSSSSSTTQSQAPPTTASSSVMDQGQSNFSWDGINSPSNQQTPPGTMSLIPSFGSPTSLAPILVSGGGSTGPVLKRGQSQTSSGERGRDWDRNPDRARNEEGTRNQSSDGQSFGKGSDSNERWGEVDGLSDPRNDSSSSSDLSTTNHSKNDSSTTKDSQRRSPSRSQPPAIAPPQPAKSSSFQSPLPSQSRTSASPFNSKMEGDEYDWANFVFAYSRGRWDPNRLPRPPGRSTAHPGVLTRIEPNGGVTMTFKDESVSDVRADNLVAHCEQAESGSHPPQSSSSSSAEPEAELQAMRRPSLTYVGTEGTELSDQSIANKSVDSSQSLSTDTVIASSSGRQISALTPVGPTAAGDSIGGLISRTPPPASPRDSDLNPFSETGPPDRGGSLPPAPSPHAGPLADAYALAHGSHSSPNALATTHAAILAQKVHQEFRSSTSFNPKVTGGSKSTPDVLPTLGASRQSLATRRSDPAPRIEDNVWHTPIQSSWSKGQDPVSTQDSSTSSAAPSERPHVSTATPGSAFQPLPGVPRGPSASSSAPSSSQTHATTPELRPALSTQFSALSLGSSGSGSDHTNVTIHAGDSSESEGHAPRPGPTPVQDPSPENSADLLQFLSPTSTRSAPEVPLSGAAAILRRSADVEERENPGSGGTRDLDTSIAALRRAAARRTSVAKELSASLRFASHDNGKGKQVLHSSTFPGSLPSSNSTSHSTSERSIEDLTSDTTNSNEYPLQLSSPPSSARFSSQSVEAKEESARATQDDSQQLGKSRASSIDPKRRALPSLGTPSSPITSRARTTSDLVRQPSGGVGSSGVEGGGRNGNGNGNGSQISPTSPAIKNYLAAGRRAENFYKEHGYLPSIFPPNELERRQALRRYGSPKVAANVNFDRIAHLVKLVFNTKLVLISLVGENEQIFQTETGGGGDLSLPALQKSAGARDCSFCAHSILQDGDEPIVVLDTWRDWRFAGNPLVLGKPHIRFYCGCPLRTPDGFNLGSLCIIDDKPWPEFNPRQRHTLKEFARVVMREMELMRDQIQLGMRDRMQNSIELFTRECLEVESEDVQDSSASSTHGGADSTTGSTGASPVGLHRVYELAAKSMQDALQASGAIIFDLSHFELVDSFAHEGGSGGKIFFPSPYSNPGTTPFASFDDPSNIEATVAGEGNASTSNPTDLPAGKAASLKGKTVPPMAILGASEDTEDPPNRENAVPLSHHIKVAEFLRSHRTGHYFPFSPSPFSSLLPNGVTNLMLVPIFGLNKQPFALLCAYAQGTESGTALEELKDSGLQYLRALGMIILSAVLKKDIMLADKAKSHFISNISHELRTPLHGILAAAELLSETKLDVTQDSYLDTVEACGKSLLELVNHVLDFTKLSGGASVDRQHSRSQCDLVKLVQEVCESSWIGQMAKALESQQQSGIGSVYAPPSGSVARSSITDESAVKKLRTLPVETVIDVSMRSTGWLVNCDTGGIRRVLMNLIGNSLKFTSKGFVHVAIREVQSSDTHIIVELGVTDTGRGISRTFLEEQLFHPFTQENTLGTGTGLGLSIVNSIVQSPSINGKIDVWSTVGQGTEIRVTCELELCSPDDAEGTIYIPALDVQKQRTCSFLGFDNSRGQENLREVLSGYFEDWWKFAQVHLEGDQIELVADPSADLGDIVLINENVALLDALRKRKSPLPPAIFLTSARGDAEVSAACDAYHQAGGVARMLFKPAGPAKLEAVVDFCLQCLDRIQAGDPPASEETDPSSRMPSPLPSPASADDQAGGYFNAKSRNRHPQSDDAEDETPKDPSLKTPVPDLTTPRLTRPNNNDAGVKLRESSHHMSPEAPPDPSSSLIRRHSTEDRVMQSRAGGIVMESQNSADASSHSYSRQSRPMLPARSITYHEPRLQKHVLVSPHGSNPLGSGGSSSSRKRNGREEEQQDYFSRSVSGQSNPSSPGSQISLEGGDGAVLKSALKGGYGSSNASKKRMQILSVEDNAINRRVIAAFLSKMEVDFVEASNGEEGVQIFQAYPPNHFDVVLMDLSMPVLDGIGATAAIRRIEAERHEASMESKPAARKGSASSFASSISSKSGSQSSRQPRAKIFALTGRSSEEDKRQALATGADGYMVKPLSFKVLSSLLKMLAR